MSVETWAERQQRRHRLLQLDVLLAALEDAILARPHARASPALLAKADALGVRHTSRPSCVDLHAAVLDEQEAHLIPDAVVVRMGNPRRWLWWDDHAAQSQARSAAPVRAVSGGW